MRTSISLPSPPTQSSLSFGKETWFCLSEGLRRIASSWPGRRTFAALALACGVFYGLDWIWLRGALTHSLVFLLEQSGYAPQMHVLEIVFPVARFPITAECTYVDLALCMAPFFWRDHLSFRRNLIRLTVLALTVTCLNEVRVLWAILGTLRGHSWFTAHDLPDLMLWYGGLSVAILGWGRWIVRHIQPQTSQQT